MRNSVIISLIIIVSLAFFISCAKKKSEPVVVPIVNTVPCDSTGTISYSIQIVPIINASCGASIGACHNNTSTFGDFNSYQGFTSHPPSHIIHCIKQDDPANYQPMPLGASKLSACKIAKIVNWVNQGELNN